jgi:signal transduction histidine kinase
LTPAVHAPGLDTAPDRRRLIVVEDDRQILSAVSDALGGEGYAVETYQNGKEAMDRLHLNGPQVHLILLDLMMPGMNGWEFRAMQKADPVLNSIPVVAMSANATAQAAAIDAACFLRKPVRLQDLLSAVERVLLDTERQAAKARMDEAQRLASLGTLAAGVGHEITNPLAYLIDSLELLEGLVDRVRRQPDGSPVDLESSMAEMASLVLCSQKGTERIRLVVKTLHSLARRPDGQRTMVDVHKVLASSTAMAWNLIRHRARLVQRLDQVRPLLGDESRLGQLFVNLLINAAQAIPEGNAEQHEIRVCTRQEGNQVLVEIADSGAGIAPHVRARLFEPFFTTKPVGVGTGLGLSICQSVADEHGGKLEVQSELGKGSLFRVWLPCAAGSAPATLPSPGAALSAVPKSSRLRVLVVEDEQLVANAVKRMLARDHEVTLVDRGSEALNLLATGHQFDAIVCDLMMPNMTGMQLYAEVERLHPGVLDRFLFMTGGAFSADADGFLQRLSSGPLVKPFQPRELLEAIDRIVRVAGAASVAVLNPALRAGGRGQGRGPGR